MAVDIANLQEGDLVIQYTGRNNTPPAQIVGSHAMIFIGDDLLGLPTVVHQIGMSGLLGTHHDVLVPNSRPDDDESATQRKRILRCKNAHLATAAANYARSWSERFQVDFGEERAGSSQLFEDRMRKVWTTPDQMTYLHRRLFDSVGKWRAIKYAARRNGYLCYPGEDDYKGKGMHCSMFATICYQVAGLAAVVDPAPDDPGVRVSDKRMWDGGKEALKDMKVGSTDSIMYGLYVKTLNEHDFYESGNAPRSSKPGAPNVKYIPGVSLWRGPTPVSGTNWATLVTEGMQVDAKVIKATSLYQSLCADTKGWDDLGDLVGEKRPENGNRTQRILDRNVAAGKERSAWLKR